MKTLEQHGILHRDISAGNVFLSADPRPGYEAFLADFELAKIPPPTKLVATTISRPVHVIHMHNERQVPDEVTCNYTTWREEIDYTRGPDMTVSGKYMSSHIDNDLSFCRELCNLCL